MAKPGRPEGTTSVKTRRVLKLIDLQIALDDGRYTDARVLAREIAELTEQEPVAPRRERVPA